MNPERIVCNGVYTFGPITIVAHYITLEALLRRVKELCDEC